MRDAPMNRIADPEGIAGAVAFLRSSDDSAITRHTVPVDGGQAADWIGGPRAPERAEIKSDRDASSEGDDFVIVIDERPDARVAVVLGEGG